MAFAEALAFAETLISVTALTARRDRGMAAFNERRPPRWKREQLMMSDKLVRIGGASGAWGDSPGAIGQLLGAGVDYLMMDYLAEVTMSLLARARMKDPTAGYPPDAVAYLRAVLPEIAQQRRAGRRPMRGGVNPAGCKRALEDDHQPSWPCRYRRHGGGRRCHAAHRQACAPKACAKPFRAKRCRRAC